ncbi:hypothetical protein ACFLZ7_02435 [Nanoarchaeota archaeon]
MDLFDDYEDDKTVLNEIDDKKTKTFRSMLNRKNVSGEELDEMFIGM